MTLTNRARMLMAIAAGGALLLAGCGSGDGSSTAAPAPAGSATATDTAPADDPVSLPPGARPGLDDLNGDGTPDPTCGQQDFGGGLVLRIPCTVPNPNEPGEGVRLVKGSLFGLPSFDADLTGISGSLVTARDADGKKVVIVVFNTDNLFATGSDQLDENNTLGAVVALINAKFAGSAIQVRGHTDKTGTAAGNQALSQRRAGTVKAYLTGHGVNVSAVTAVGLGSDRPLAEETNADGSASLPGRAFNRRVEIALRLP